MKTYRIIFAIVGWAAFLYSFFSDFSHPVDFFSYFTIQSNLLIICWFTLSLLSGCRSFIFRPAIRSGLLVYITATMIVFFVLLFNSSVGLNFITSYVLHLIIPLGYIVDWLIDRPREKIKLKTAFSWLIYPMVYCVYTFIRGGIVGWYPYYFLSPVKMESYGRVEVAVLGLAGFFIVIILSVYYGHNKLVGNKLFANSIIG